MTRQPDAGLAEQERATPDEFVLIANGLKRACRECGLVHPYLSHRDEGFAMSCATPVVFTRETAEKLSGFGEIIPLPAPPEG